MLALLGCDNHDCPESESSGSSPTPGVWEWEGINGTWQEYDPIGQRLLEEQYQLIQHSETLPPEPVLVPMQARRCLSPSVLISLHCLSPSFTCPVAALLPFTVLSPPFYRGCAGPDADGRQPATELHGTTLPFLDPPLPFNCLSMTFH